MHPTTESISRFPDEVERLRLASELEDYLTPLAARCDELEAAPSLSEADAQLLYQLTGFIGAIARYDQATDQLLASYRYALEHAEKPAPEPIPTLEQALVGQMNPAALLAYRQKDPVYQLGFGRGYRQGEVDTTVKYERLANLYAQHTIIVPPLNYQPSPLVARLKKYLGTLLMAGPKLPLGTRQLLFSQTPTTSTVGN